MKITHQYCNVKLNPFHNFINNRNTPRHLRAGPLRVVLTKLLSLPPLSNSPSFQRFRKKKKKSRVTIHQKEREAKRSERNEGGLSHAKPT